MQNFTFWNNIKYKLALKCKRILLKNIAIIPFKNTIPYHVTGVEGSQSPPITSKMMFSFTFHKIIHIARPMIHN